MIPADYPITVVQGGTFRLDVQLLENVRAVTLTAGSDLIGLRCHGFVAGDVVGFRSDEGTFPCGMRGVTGYYVIASGLTSDAFRVSATLGGATIGISPIAEDLTGIRYEVGKAVSLAGATLDADVKSLIDGSLAATFTETILASSAGTLRMELSAATTVGMPASDQYAYDLNYRIGGDSYYPMGGQLTVVATRSRP